MSRAVALAFPSSRRHAPRPWRRPLRSLAAVSAAAALLGAPPAQAEAENGSAGPAGTSQESASPVDLEGTWYVLVHYRDSATANPEADRWQDRVWVFEKRGSRLLWTDYPIVVFEDGSGRFEPRAGNPRARTLDAWEPNEAQRAEIAAGPQVNRQRGSRSKSLRRTPEGDWRSAGSLRAQSASVIGYHETWTIEDPDGQPVFSRRDVMGTGLSGSGSEEQSLSGLTRYATTRVVDEDTLEGRFARDEHRRGRFRMLRAGSLRDLESDGRTPNQRAADRAREAVRQEMERRLREGDPEAVREIREEMRREREKRP